MTASEDDPAAFEERLDEIADALAAAETEADLDEVEASIKDVEADLAEATFPEPEPPEDEEEEEPPDPREELEDRLDDLRDDLEDQRGPYAEDIVGEITTASGTISRTEWAEEGLDELVPVVERFVEAVESALDTDLDGTVTADDDALADVLGIVSDAVEDSGLDADEDAETIAALLDATTELNDGVEAATAFDDLPVREQLHRHGFFDVLGHYKDFPPEWSAIKAHEEAGDVEMILLAFDLLDSNFLEDHCVDALRRIADERALDDMAQLARRRDHGAIEVLGKIGSDEPVDMLLDYAETEGDPRLQQVAIKALGEIGSEKATETVAQQLGADDPEVRSGAARSLGMIGDPRAIEPLADVLDEDDAWAVRGSAAWALVQIGTEAALEIVTEHEADRSNLVEDAVTKARTGLAEP